MGDGLYVGMAAATARTQQLDAVADNLANAQTPGFQQTTPAFQTFLSLERNAQMASVAAVDTGLDVKPGQRTETGRALDLAPSEDQWFSVRLSDGSPGFTRAGNVLVDARGVLTVAGHSLLNPDGNAISIPPGTTPTFGADGTVYVRGQVMDIVATHRLDGPLTRGAPSVVTLAEGAHSALSAGGVRVGELMMGNSSTLDAAVQLVTVQRQFETAMQAIQTYRHMDTSATELGRVRG